MGEPGLAVQTNTLGHGKVPIKERVRITRRQNPSKRVEVNERTVRECLGIAYGFFSPLTGFMGQRDVQSVCDKMQLADGTVWPIPIVLDVPERVIHSNSVQPGETIALTYGEVPFATIDVEELYRLDVAHFARSVYGTLDPDHPGVAAAYDMCEILVAGPVTLTREPVFAEPYRRFWLPPLDMRKRLLELQWERSVAHQSRNVPHIGHEWFMKAAWFAANGSDSPDASRTGIVVSCVIGHKKVGDYIDEAILLAHQELNNQGYFRKNVHLVSFVLWDARYAGPREAVLHGIIRCNLGCTHHMFGRDHAGVGDFYQPEAAHRIFDRYSEDDIAITPIRLGEWWYCPVCQEVTYSGLCGHSDQRQEISGTRVRESLAERGNSGPPLMRPEVVRMVQACAEKYGNGSSFCSKDYLRLRQPVVTFDS